MKILWVCNISLIAIKKNLEYWCGGWMTSTVGLLEKRDDLELLVCYPQSERKSFRIEVRGRLKFCGFYVKDRNKYDKNLKKVFQKIDAIYEPDVVHIFGTEFPHSLLANRVWREKAVISIQGLIGIYAKHYFIGIPARVVYRKKHINGRLCSIYNDMLELKNRGVYEYKTLKYARYVLGRTEWDYACVRHINEKTTYIKCNEILRDCFYEGQWVYDNCNKHSILISQADYPIKGFHIFLKALRIIKAKFPDVQVSVAGRSIGLEAKILDPYASYITELLEKFRLKENIQFIGIQSEEKMKEQFLKTNVFVLPSLIENSPNSLGEAMILGVPSVVSDVGGVSSQMKHGEEGFSYQVDAHYMLAHYVEKIFEDETVAMEISQRARMRALQTYDQEENLKTLINVYKELQDQYK